jgi:hypothetical protein
MARDLFSPPFVMPTHASVRNIESLSYAPSVSPPTLPRVLGRPAVDTAVMFDLHNNDYSTTWLDADSKPPQTGLDLAV